MTRPAGPGAPPAATVAGQDWPVPPRTPETAFFWEGTVQGELRVQACSSCGRLRHPPRPGCPECGSLDWTYTLSQGLGTVYSFAVHYRPAVPGPALPYASAIVELDEGVRMLTNIVDTPFGDLFIGMRVAVTFRAVRAGLTLPLFAALPLP